MRLWGCARAFALARPWGLSLTARHMRSTITTLAIRLAHAFCPAKQLQLSDPSFEANQVDALHGRCYRCWVDIQIASGAPRL